MVKERKKLLHSHHDKNFMEVIDQGDYRSLYFQGSVVQSRICLKDPGRLILRYTQYMMAAALLSQPNPARILLIGIGAGALLHFFHRHFPNSRVEAVDYSEHIIKIARGFFSLPQSENIIIHCEDGLQFLQNSDTNSRYDLILLDAFTDTGMAKNIYSNEFFGLAEGRLSDTGILCCNLWSGNQKAFNRVKKAIRKHSASSLYIPVRKRENVIALLFQGQIPWRRICPPGSILHGYEKKYSIYFSEVSNTARKHNMKLGEKLQQWFN